jgi:GrpB-like predicted nucleotidyltransferase (UPF0157 family)
MRLRPEEETRAEVEGLFAARRAEIERSIPGAEVRHIGATAIPGSLTKGDLDLLVSVPAAEFATAAKALKGRYAINQPEVWSETFASFEERPSGPIAVGVQLAAAGSADEEMFIRWRDLLRADPDLRRRYDEVKLAAVDDGVDGYRAAKARFIESHCDR